MEANIYNWSRFSPSEVCVWPVCVMLWRTLGLAMSCDLQDMVMEGKGWGFPPPGRCGYFVSPGQMLDLHDQCLAHAGVVGLWQGRLPIASGPFRLLNFDLGIPFPSAGVGMHLSLRRVASQCSGEAVDDQGLLGPFSGCL